MRKAARKAMFRFDLLLWGGAIVMGVLQLASDSWDFGSSRAMFGVQVVVTGAAISASVCRVIGRCVRRAIDETHTGTVRQLVQALADQRPTREPDEHPHLRAVESDGR